MPSLRALHTAGHDVVLVVTQPDRRAHRGMKLTSPPVKVAAQELGLPVYQPEKIRDAESVERLRATAGFHLETFAEVEPWLPVDDADRALLAAWDPAAHFRG